MTIRSGIYLQIWGVGGKTGLFSHTDVPMMYEISRSLYVVDFPGSNSLDYHAKTFSICGAMNNMIILILPFTGDVSQIISEEVAQVFSVMKGSDATQVSTTNTVDCLIIVFFIDFSVVLQCTPLPCRSFCVSTNVDRF